MPQVVLSYNENSFHILSHLIFQNFYHCEVKSLMLMNTNLLALLNIQSFRYPNERKTLISIKGSHIYSLSIIIIIISIAPEYHYSI